MLSGPCLKAAGHVEETLHRNSILSVQTRIFPVKTVSKGENTCLMWEKFPLKNSGVLGCTKKKHYLCAHKHETT